MPNWCSNEILIFGDPEKVRTIWKVLDNIEDHNENIVFRSLCGINPTVSKEEYESGKWYDANIEYWGTKWDVSLDDCQMTYEDDVILMSPNTAWSPPVNFCVKLSREYGVNVEIVYYEIGNDFSGRVRIDNGTIHEDIDGTYYEGLYKIDRELFWTEVQLLSFLEKTGSEDTTAESLIERRLKFMTDADKERFIEEFKLIEAANNKNNP